MYLEFGVELGGGKGAELLTHSSYRSCHRDILVLSRRTSHLITQPGPPSFSRRQQGLQELTGVQNPTSLASLPLTSLPPAAGKGQVCARCEGRCLAKGTLLLRADLEALGLSHTPWYPTHRLK